MLKEKVDDLVVAISESCTQFSDRWKSEQTLSLDNIYEIREAMSCFIYQNNKDLMGLFSYAENQGRYHIVDVLPLTKLWEPFETYYTDFHGFLSNLMSLSSQNQLSENTTELICKARDADVNFFKQNYNPEEVVHISFPAALEACDVQVRFMVLLDEIYDMIIRLNNASEEFERVGAMRDVYVESVTRFLSHFSKTIMEYVNGLFDLAQAPVCGEKKKTAGFCLI